MQRVTWENPAMVDESETAAKARQIDSEVIRSRAKLDKAQNELNATERKELLSFVPDFSVQLGQFSTSPTPERKRILRTTIPRIVFSGHQVVAVTLRFRPREAVSRASKGITPRAAFPIRNRTGMDSHFSVGH